MTTATDTIDVDPDSDTTEFTLPPWYLAICDAVARAIIYAGYIGLGFGLTLLH